MVTGIETAGLVLGALPLVISALEHYADGIETIHKWWRYRRELASLRRILDAEYVRYLNTCEELLSGIVTDTVLAQLLGSPGGSGWQDPNIDRKLRSRLRMSFNSYLETVNDINDVLSILKNKLELDPDGKLKWNDAHKFQREYKRIKLSLSKSSYGELMKRIEKDNDTLARLTGQSLRLEPTRQRRTHRTTDFDRVRTQAESFYRVPKKNWRCSCQIPHNASFRLEARITGPEDEGSGTPRKMRFRMVFAFDTNHAAGNHIPWKPRETELEPVGFYDDAVTSLSPVPLSPLRSPCLTPSPSLLPARPKRAVRWASDTSQQPSSETLAPPSSGVQPADFIMV